MTKPTRILDRSVLKKACLNHFRIPFSSTQGPGRGAIVSIDFSHIPNWLESMLEASYPIGSMYGIFTRIWFIFMVNVGKYTIHGSYGYVFFRCRDTFLTQTFWISHRCHQAIWTQTFHQLHQRKFLNSQGFCNCLSDLQHTRILSLEKKSGKNIDKWRPKKSTVCDIVCE